MCPRIRSRKKPPSEDTIGKLSEVSEALDITLGREKLLRACTDKLISAFSWEFGAVYAAEARSKELVLEHDRHASDAFKAKLSRLPIGEGLGGFMEKTREPLFIRMKKYPSHLAHRKVFQELGLESLLIIPLTRESFGGMIIRSKKEKEAHLHSPDLLSAVSAGIGTALANATSYGEIDRLAKERHNLIDSISPVLYIAAPNGQMTFIGKEIAQMTGFADREFYKDGSMLLKLVHPDDKAILLERTLRLDAIQAREMVEYRILPRGRASYRTVRDEFSCVRDDKGNVISIQGAITDITEEGT
jgi:PAS domain S-box-containing protein